MKTEDLPFDAQEVLRTLARAPRVKGRGVQELVEEQMTRAQLHGAILRAPTDDAVSAPNAHALAGVPAYILAEWLVELFLLRIEDGKKKAAADQARGRDDTVMWIRDRRRDGNIRARAELSWLVSEIDGVHRRAKRILGVNERRRIVKILEDRLAEIARAQG